MTAPTGVRQACWWPECNWPVQGAGTEPRPCYNHQFDDTERYPVIITWTEQHVVWVEAVDAKDAAERAQYDTYELIDRDTTLARADLTAHEPDRWDYEFMVYDGGEGYNGLPCDAHVREYRERERRAAQAACVEAGHPNPAEYRGRPGHYYCPTCYVGVEAPAGVTS